MDDQNQHSMLDALNGVPPSKRTKYVHPAEFESAADVPVALALPRPSIPVAPERSVKRRAESCSPKKKGKRREEEAVEVLVIGSSPPVEDQVPLPHNSVRKVTRDEEEQQEEEEELDEYGMPPSAQRQKR